MFFSKENLKDCLLKNRIILDTLKSFFSLYLNVGLTKIKVVSGFEIEIYINYRYIYPFIFFINKHSMCQFHSLIDVICYDKPTKKNRFEIVYSFLSVAFNTRLHVITKVAEFSNLLSITSLFHSSNWIEREVFDFYGIYFFQNFDLRRILNDYGFKGFPLRKDFPITGYIDIYYDDNQKRICYKNLELSQEYKDFNFKLIWK